LGDFKNALPQALVKEGTLEVKTLLNSTYFMNPQVVHVFTMELLERYSFVTPSFSDIKHNYSMDVYCLVLDNIIFLLRRICQNPHFDDLIKSEPILKLTLVEIYADFLKQAGTTLSDVTFLTKGPIQRLNTAFNLSIIVERLCEGSLSVKKYAQKRAEFGDPMEKDILHKSAIPIDERRSIISHFKYWYEVILEVAPTIASNPGHRKFSKILAKLLEKIGSAASQLMLLGISYEGNQLPKGFHKWLAMLENEGRKVLSSKILTNHDEALGIALSSSYSGRGFKSPYCFTEAIFRMILPSLEDSPSLYLERKTRRMTFAEEYLASLHLLPIRETVEQTVNSPLITAKEKARIRQHLGSLLFHGNFVS
jgi:hypothetical protein